MEFDRMTVGPKHQNVVDNTELDEEEANATIDGQLNSSLVGIVSEGDLDEAMFGSLYKLQAYLAGNPILPQIRSPRKGLSLQNHQLCYNEWYVLE
jgi:hypothetical protein